MEQITHKTFISIKFSTCSSSTSSLYRTQSSMAALSSSVMASSFPMMTELGKSSKLSTILLPLNLSLTFWSCLSPKQMETLSVLVYLKPMALMSAWLGGQWVSPMASMISLSSLGSRLVVQLSPNLSKCSWQKRELWLGRTERQSGERGRIRSARMQLTMYFGLMKVNLRFQQFQNPLVLKLQSLVTMQCVDFSGFLETRPSLSSIFFSMSWVLNSQFSSGSTVNSLLWNRWDTNFYCETSTAVKSSKSTSFITVFFFTSARVLRLLISFGSYSSSSSDISPSFFFFMVLVQMASSRRVLSCSLVSPSAQSLSYRTFMHLAKRSVQSVAKLSEATISAALTSRMMEFLRSLMQQLGLLARVYFHWQRMKSGLFFPLYSYRCGFSLARSSIRSSSLNPVPTRAKGQAQVNWFPFSPSVSSTATRKLVTWLVQWLPVLPRRKEWSPKQPPMMTTSMVSVRPSTQSPLSLSQLVPRSLGTQMELGSLSITPSSLRSRLALNSRRMSSYSRISLNLTSSTLPGTSLMTLGRIFLRSLSGQPMRFISSFSTRSHRMSKILQQSWQLLFSWLSATCLLSPNGIILPSSSITMISPSRMHASAWIDSSRMFTMSSQTRLQSTPLRESSFMRSPSRCTCSLSPSYLVSRQKVRVSVLKYSIFFLPASMGRMGWKICTSSLRETLGFSNFLQISRRLLVRLWYSLASGWKVVRTVSSLMPSLRSLRMMRTIHFISAALVSRMRSRKHLTWSVVLASWSRISLRRRTVRVDFSVRQPLMTSCMQMEKSPIPIPSLWQLGFLQWQSRSYSALFRFRHCVISFASAFSFSPQLPRSLSSSGMISRRMLNVNCHFRFRLKRIVMNFLISLDLMPPRASLRQVNSRAIERNMIVSSLPSSASQMSPKVYSLLEAAQNYWQFSSYSKYM